METVTTGQKIRARRGKRSFRALAGELTKFGRTRAVCINGKWTAILGPDTAVSHGSVLRWEADKTNPGAESLVLLAGVFKCAVSDLLPTTRKVCKPCKGEQCKKCKGAGVRE